MVAIAAAAGSLVHTPCGPRKSGMPLSVEMPAPVSTVMDVTSPSRSRRVTVMRQRLDQTGVTCISAAWDGTLNSNHGFSEVRTAHSGYQRHQGPAAGIYRGRPPFRHGSTGA